MPVPTITLAPTIVSALTCDNRSGDDDAADTQASDHEDSPELAHVVHTSDRKCSTAGCHKD